MQLVVGRVGRPHGVRGQLSVEVRTETPELRFVPGAELVTDPAAVGPLVVLDAREHSGRLLVTFAGVGDRTAAEGLRGVLLLAEVDPDADDEASDDGWYDHELVGLSARLADGTVVGEVVEVVHRPAQDALAVRRTDGVRVEVPFVEAIVPTVDLAAGVVVLTPPGGLLDPDAADSERT